MPRIIALSFLPLLALAACGSDSGGKAKSCTSACQKLSRCYETEQSCTLSAVCTETEQCLAECIDNATCAEITGKDKKGQLLFRDCQRECENPQPTDGGVLDVAQPASDSRVDQKLTADQRLTTDRGLKPDRPVLPDVRGDQLAPDKPRPDSKPPADGGKPTTKWVTIPKGSFSMGSPVSEACREESLKETLHTVTLTHSFNIMNHEVTQGQFSAQVGYNPSYYAFCGKDCPVEMVTWHDAVAYCNKLSANQSLTSCYTDVGTGAICSSDSTCAGGESCIKGIWPDRRAWPAAAPGAGRPRTSGPRTATTFSSPTAAASAGSVAFARSPDPVLVSAVATLARGAGPLRHDRESGPAGDGLSRAPVSDAGRGRDRRHGRG